MIRYSCHSENFGILSAEHTFSLIHDLQFDCIDIASRSLIPQNQIQADPAATSAYLKDLSQRYELPLSELFLSEVEVNGEKSVLHAPPLYRNHSAMHSGASANLRRMPDF